MVAHTDTHAMRCDVSSGAECEHTVESAAGGSTYVYSCDIWNQRMRDNGGRMCGESKRGTQTRASVTHHIDGQQPSRTQSSVSSASQTPGWTLRTESPTIGFAIYRSLLVASDRVPGAVCTQHAHDERRKNTVVVRQRGQCGCTRRSGRILRNARLIAWRAELGGVYVPSIL